MTRTRRLAAAYIALAAAVAVLFALNLFWGSVSLAPGAVLTALLGKGGDALAGNIILQLRLPRAVMAALLGAALSAAGYLLQTFFANPIAGPFVMGVSSGAKLAVALTMVVFLDRGMLTSSATMIAAAFAGAMAAMAFVLAVARRVQRMSILVICGVMIGYICSAITDIVVAFAQDSNIVNLHNWSQGSFSGVTWANVQAAALVVLPALAASFLLSKPMAAYQMGEAYARSVGVNVKPFSAALVLLSSLLAACVTAFAGPISFVGIAVPHLVKQLLGSAKPLYVLPGCCLGGAAFCLFCDLLARSLFAPTELSISSVTAVFGAPVVIWLLVRRSHGGRTMNEEHFCAEHRSLAIGYGKTPLLSDICLGAQPGQILTLIGPNGAGKSTLLKTLAGQLAPMGGTVLLAGKDLTAYTGTQRAQKLALMAPHSRRMELTTCFDFVSAGRYPYTGRLGILSAEDRQQVHRALELVGAAQLADRDFNRISDGQRQRILLARALCQQPEVILLDEPTSFLDIKGKIELLTILKELAHTGQLAVILSLHELELAEKIADTVVCVSPGGVSGVLTPEQAFQPENIRTLYGLTEQQYTALFGTPEPEAEKAPAGKPQFEHYVRSGQKLLRCGYTTGTCAALGAAGAARLLLTGREPETVALRTPKGIVVEVAPIYCRRTDAGAVCAIRKDGGDDVDVTTGLPVVASVVLEPDAPGVRIFGGEGVGRVTKPGLDQPVGEAAINHVPRRMIAEALEREAENAAYTGGFAVTISVEGGAETAKRTFNPHIGVEGGLSILGTSGIVEPMSQQAILDTIQLEMNQAALRAKNAPGPRRLVLAPGNYGLDYLASALPQFERFPVVKTSNFIGDTLDMAATAKFEEVLLVGHVGKLCQAGGRGHEHPLPHGGWPR